MTGNSGETSASHFRAVGMGVVWGLSVLVLGSVLQGIVSYMTPLSTKTVDVMAMVWQGAAGLLGGFAAARRAEGAGWLHGALAGAALVLSIAAVMGFSSVWPGLAALARMTGVMTGTGVLGGIAGVNAERR